MTRDEMRKTLIDAHRVVSSYAGNVCVEDDLERAIAWLEDEKNSEDYGEYVERYDGTYFSRKIWVLR